MPGLMQDPPQPSKKEGGGSAWKSVDRLDNPGKVLKVTNSPVRQTPDCKCSCSRTFIVVDLLWVDVFIG